MKINKKFIKIIQNTNKGKCLLWAILLLALLLRLYKIQNPVADWHAFRQADTASVTREYFKASKIDILRPHYHDLSNIQSGQDNLQGYRMVEFPFVNAGLALILKSFPSWDLVLVSRLASALISLATIFSLFQLVKILSGKKVAYLSALIFAVLPYVVFYSRVVLPEPYLLFLSTFSIWQFLLFSKDKRLTNYLLSLFALALAALLKPFVIFLAPVYLAILWQERKAGAWKNWQTFIYPLLAFVPMLLWRDWIKQFPSGIAVSDWLFNGNGIRFRPAWFRWLFYERISKLMIGFVGVLFLFANLLFGKSKKDLLVYAAWWLGILAYFIVIATGNVQHDYYQNLALPILVISLARGIVILQKYLNELLENSKQIRRNFSSSQIQQVTCYILFTLFLLMLFFSWKQVVGYYQVNHPEYIEAGQAVDRLSPVDAWVIAPAMGDTQFLFQTNRRGWPIGFEIEDKISKGADIYVSTSYDDEAKQLESAFLTIEKNDSYLILNLQEKKDQ